MIKLTKRQNIKISIILTFITLIFSTLIHIFYTPFLLNKVGDAQYGLYGFTTSALSWLTVAINAIMSAYNKIVSEEIAKNPDEGEKTINSIYSFIVIIWALIVTITASVLIILMYSGVVSFDSYSESDQSTLRILFIIVAIQMVITILTNVSTINITYNNHHVWIKGSTLLVTVLTPLISIPFLLNGCNIIVIVGIQVVLNSISHIVNIFYDRFALKKQYPIFPKKEFLKQLKPIFIFCSIILVNEIAYQVDNSIDNIVLGTKGLSSDITLYSLALSIVMIANTCSNMLYTPFIPTVFKNEASNNQEANKHLFDLLTFLQIVLWLFVTGGFISAGKIFTKLWIGEERIIVYYICSSLFIIRSVSNCCGPSRDMMRARNKHYHRAILAVGVALINAIFTIIFVEILPLEKAIWGCVIGTAASSFLGWWIVSNVMNYYYLKIDIKRYIKTFIIILFISAVGTAVTILMQTYILKTVGIPEIVQLIISILLFCACFIGLLFCFYKKQIKECYLLFKSK